jgi:hypothetical protein
MRRTPIRERIRTAFGGRTRMKYFDLMCDVFPPDEYPRAWRYSHNGGPPGCCMALGRALRKMGADVSGMGSARTVYLKKAKKPSMEEED